MIDLDFKASTSFSPLLIADLQSLVVHQEYAMGRTAPGQAEEMVKVLRLVMGGLQIPFIFFLMP